MVRPRALVSLLPLLLLAACGDDPAPARTFAATACGDYGVVEGAPIPETCPLEIAEDGDSVRVFAVGAIPRYSEMETYADFCETWDTVVRTQVLPCLAEDRPNLLVLPENATLSAAFIGSRGANGRAATDTITGFLGFFGSYIAPLNFYRERFPGRDDQALILVALTDTFHRAFQTFPSIARTYGVHLAVSSDFAPAEPTDDPAALAALADPDLPKVERVWVATEGAAYNWGLVFGPDGTELGRVPKSYLVPDEEDLLILAHGPLPRMRPLALPFARAGMVISKDAWMPNVLERLDLLGADLMLQPEAFSGWGVAEYEGDWLPDVVRAAGWAHVQRSGTFRYNVTPCLKGNLLGLAYDCQSHVAKDARPDDPLRCFVGQDPYPGLLAVEPWAMADPGAPLSLADRRTRLAARGEAMLPGSGDPLEDAYTNQVVAADLDLPADGRHPVLGDGPVGPLGASAGVLSAADPEAHQRRPDLAVDGGRVLLVLQEGDRAGGRIRLAVSPDGGDTWSEVAPLHPADGRLRRAPRVAGAGDRWLVAWEREDTATTDTAVEGAVSLDGGTTWRPLALGSAAGAWEPAVAVDPVTGRLFVAWLDLRQGARPKPFLAWSDDGAAWTEVQVDPANARDDDPRGDAAFVSVLARDGRVHVGFTDFRAYAWDVYVADSDDGGGTFAPARRLDPLASQLIRVADGATVEAERLHGEARLAWGPGGAPLMIWSDLADRRANPWIRLRLGEATVRVDDGSVGAFRPAAATTADGRLVTVWQDLSSGASHVRLAVGEGTPPGFGASVPVDDAAPGAQVVSPAVAAGPGGPVVAFEDYRDGAARVRVVVDRR